MTEHEFPQRSEPDDGSAPLYPLLPVDPPRIGPYWLEARVTASASGVAYAAHATDGTVAMVIMLSEGAADACGGAGDGGNFVLEFFHVLTSFLL